LTFDFHVFRKQQRTLYYWEMSITKPRTVGKTITIMPKIMQKTANTGLEMMMPIFFNPLSITSVKKLTSSE